MVEHRLRTWTFNQYGIRKYLCPGPVAVDLAEELFTVLLKKQGLQ